MNWLRSGHTQLAHGYILDNTGPRVTPICMFCDDAVITVEHLLLTCPALVAERNRLRLFRGNRSVTLENMLGKSGPVDQVVEFLKRIHVYDKI